MANNNKADIFISLHANASVRAVRAGAEVFYLSLDGLRRSGAARRWKRESESLPVFGGGGRDIELISGTWRRRGTSSSRPRWRRLLEGSCATACR